MRNQPRVVPWLNYEEFFQVFQWLYASIEDHPDLVQRGIDRVLAWINRGRVPIAVKATMDLVELQLRERKQTHGTCPLTQNELQLLYGSALTRFVNILEDSLQKGYYARSMYAIADDIGLPRHFVQIRHSATHEEGLPSLPVLRRAGTEALQWLHDVYWMAQIRPDGVDSVSASTVEDLGILVRQYKLAQKECIRSSSEEQQEVAAKRTKTRDGLIVKIIEMLEDDTLKHSIVPVLLRCGYLIPTSKKKRVSLEHPDFDTILVSLWAPLLRSLDNSFNGFFLDLVTGIFDRLHPGDYYASHFPLSEPPTILRVAPDPEEEKQKHPSYLMTLTAWLQYFLVKCETSKNIFSSDVFVIVVEGALQHPCAYSRLILRTAIEKYPSMAKPLRPFMVFMETMSKLSKHEDQIPNDLAVKVDEVLERDNDEAMEKRFMAWRQEVKSTKKKGQI
ncbi:Las1-domain-containing protein [Hesseltinella vesiculosa]|uniref:Las1-domain-containing protein n=1 Tax=Hesseltinella vesiculosa TaxID=101127 RepID=A0A1X2GJ91_9FUNG|nr:Las1-domain-containing protein [Hesseltinella vesiculosa]